ncbi:MAG TPA: glutamine-hydrolyzing carbamoyl-phosphate synthase small subunit [Chloroflexia bacterium]|nr:glutamine-hydrolyzing carbamoyl-phosphate synthase small subunit [Chloroflexia bacterium]
MTEKLAGLLVLADGTVVEGTGAGAPGLAVGELVFQTGMTGYQEVVTDPSYAGQLLTFTYPLVGNYGVGPDLSQSTRIHARGVVVRDLMPSAGHRDTTTDFDGWLRTGRIPALTGVDTRFITREVRMHGVIPAALAVAAPDALPPVAELQSRAAALDYDAVDFVADCSTPDLLWYPPTRADAPRVALIDYGTKGSTLAHLRAHGAGVWVVPAHYDAEAVLALQPDGVLLSNGPGDPARLDYAVATVRGLLAQDRLPVFGICLGHQLLALAAGGHTVKMAFGHRGVNQPVQDLRTGRVVLTTQNHGYVVNPARIPAGYLVTHTNLNDGTVEGLAHVARPVWGVQWHPEAHPGPLDTRSLLDDFLAAAEEHHA